MLEYLQRNLWSNAHIMTKTKKVDLKFEYNTKIQTWDTTKKRLWGAYYSALMQEYNPYLYKVEALIKNLSDEPEPNYLKTLTKFAQLSTSMIKTSNQLNLEYLKYNTQIKLEYICIERGVDYKKLIDSARVEFESKKKQKKTKPKRKTKK